MLVMIITHLKLNLILLLVVGRADGLHAISDLVFWPRSAEQKYFGTVKFLPMKRIDEIIYRLKKSFSVRFPEEKEKAHVELQNLNAETRAAKMKSKTISKASFEIASNEEVSHDELHPNDPPINDERHCKETNHYLRAISNESLFTTQKEERNKLVSSQIQYRHSEIKPSFFSAVSNETAAVQYGCYRQQSVRSDLRRRYHEPASTKMWEGINAFLIFCIFLLCVFGIFINHTNLIT